MKYSSFSSRYYPWIRIVIVLLFGGILYFMPSRYTPLLLPSAHAQTTAGTLSGTVTDEKGLVIVGVNITVSNVGTGLPRQTTTGNDGLFTIPLLPPGTYRLRAEHEGFNPVEIDNIELPVGGRVALD